MPPRNPSDGVPTVLAADPGKAVRNCPIAYLLTAFQIHQTITATTTQGSSALSNTRATNTTTAETAVRLVSAFASSVMKRQRGNRGMRVSRRGGTQQTLLVQRVQGEAAGPEVAVVSGMERSGKVQSSLTRR